MNATASAVLVRPYPSRHDFERRVAERHDCALDATTHPLEATDTLAWGATVRDVSRTGVGLAVCFPFRAGTYLAVDLHGRSPGQPARTMLTRVAHVRDHGDGTWHVGCEFVKPLTQDEFEKLV